MRRQLEASGTKQSVGVFVCGGGGGARGPGRGILGSMGLSGRQLEDASVSVLMQHLGNNVSDS